MVFAYSGCPQTAVLLIPVPHGLMESIDVIFFHWTFLFMARGNHLREWFLLIEVVRRSQSCWFLRHVGWWNLLMCSISLILLFMMRGNHLREWFLLIEVVCRPQSCWFLHTWADGIHWCNLFHWFFSLRQEEIICENRICLLRLSGVHPMKGP